MALLQISRQGHTLVLTLNNPSRRNVLSVELCQAISAVVKGAGESAELKLVVITGMGTAFCAGADLQDLKEAAGGDGKGLTTIYQTFIDVIECPLPTIAVVNGPAVGAGMNLALACDMRIAGENAYFDTRFLKLGLHPGGGHTWMLQRAVGWANACQMLLLGQGVGADDAARFGLVQRVAPTDQLLAVAEEFSRNLTSTPRDLLIAAKSSLKEASAGTHRDSVQRETVEQRGSMLQPHFLQMVSRLQDDIASR